MYHQILTINLCIFDKFNFVGTNSMLTFLAIQYVYRGKDRKEYFSVYCLTVE